METVHELALQTPTPIDSMFIDQVDDTTVITLPDTLGGGSIEEPDYQCNTMQTKMVDYLLTKQEVNPMVMHQTASDLKISVVQSKYEEWDYDALEVLRILSPVRDRIIAKLVNDEEVTSAEQLFSDKFVDLVKQTTDRETARNGRRTYARLDEIDPDELQKIVGRYMSTRELQRQQRIWADELIEERRTDMVERERTETPFTQEYRASKLGRITMQLLDGTKTAQDIVSPFSAVAGMDSLVSPHTRPPHAHSIAVAAMEQLGGNFGEAMIRRGGFKYSAHPKFATGDGKEVISRPNPGV